VGVDSLGRRALELLVEPAREQPDPVLALHVGVVGLSVGAGASTVALGLALELPGDRVDDGRAPGPGGVLVAVAGRSGLPVLAHLVSERLAQRHGRVVLVANRPEDPGEWSRAGVICVPHSRLAVALLSRGRRTRGVFGASLRDVARAVRAAAG
jgi:hypothetical protein